MPLLPFSDASPPTTNASLLTSGTLADARLSANVPLLNSASDQTFTNGLISGTGSVIGGGYQVFFNTGGGLYAGGGLAAGLYNYDSATWLWTVDPNGNLAVSQSLSAGSNISAGGDISGNNLAIATINSKSPAYLTANTFTAAQTITAAANTSALTASYSVTGANTTPLLNLSGTWNTTGIAKGILLNVTDTASATTSALMDLGVGSRTQYAFTKSRQFFVYNSSPATQDASNYERGIFDWTTTANVLTIGTQKAGTGTARRLRINSAEQIDFYCTDTSRMFQVSTSTVTAFNSFNWQWYSGSADPTTSTTPFNNGTSTCGVFKNTTTGLVKLWVNDGGTMKSVTLV